MTDHMEAAIEAANRELATYGAVCHVPNDTAYVESIDKEDEGDVAKWMIEAAEPHLRRKWADELRENLNPPSNQSSEIWRSGFIIGVLQSARFIEGDGK